MFNPNTNHVIVKETNGSCIKSLTQLFADLGQTIGIAATDTTIDVSAQNVFIYCDNAYKLVKFVRINSTQAECNYLVTNVSPEVIECDTETTFLVKGLDAVEVRKTITEILLNVEYWKVKNTKSKVWTSFKVIPAIHNIELVNLEVDGNYFSVNNLLNYNLF
jgi:hypothetical protein